MNFLAVYYSVELSFTLTSSISVHYVHLIDTDYSFMSIRSSPPSLIACSCLAEALQQLQSAKCPDCAEIMEYETKILNEVLFGVCAIVFLRMCVGMYALINV